jgi:beta-1,4-mannosyl-glycoprotein beta-1,4-N-acetylglucosaminyltransferase
MKKWWILVFVLSFLGLGGTILFKTPSPPKIYDCFLFFKELELLDVRLNEMYDHVHKFVIVEATETFRGKSKPLVFSENRHLFEKFADKIIYIPILEHCVTDNPWKRESFQRQQIMRGLKQCHQNDVILLSDLDEIVKGERIKELAGLITSKKLQVVVCIQKMYTGYLNRFMSTWAGTVITSFKEFKRLPVEKIRHLRNSKPRTLKKAKISKICSIENTGWHFNSMGGMSRYTTKLASFSHKELDTPDIDKAKLYEDMINPLTCVEIDDSFPVYIRTHRDHFEKIGFIEPSYQP